MNLNVALTVAKNVGWNGLVGFGHGVAGFVVAIAINKIACAIIKPEKKSANICTIQFAAGAAGIAFSLYFAPQTALVSFTANQALKLIAIGAALEISSNFVFTHNHCISRLITVGAMVGYFGTPTLTALGAVGAVLGVEFDLFYKKYC